MGTLCHNVLIGMSCSVFEHSNKVESDNEETHQTLQQLVEDDESETLHESRIGFSDVKEENDQRDGQIWIASTSQLR